MLETEVAEITVSNGKANGVRLKNGEALASDAVVSNADVAFTYLNLNAGVNYLYCPDGFNSASAGAIVVPKNWLIVSKFTGSENTLPCVVALTRWLYGIITPKRLT